MFSAAVIFAFLFLGSVAGFLAGLLGIGGGIIFVPLFLWSFPLAGFAPEVVAHAAFGTSLAIILPTTFSSTMAHRRHRNVDWHQVYLLALGSILGAIIGALLAAKLPGTTLKALFGLMQLSVAAKICLRPKHLPPERPDAPPGWQMVAVGLAAGAFSAFFGVGGGVIAVPLMVLLLQLPTHLAVGNSSALIAISSLVGALSYVFHGWGLPGLPAFSFGFVNLLVALLVAPGAMLSARFGARIATTISSDKLLKIFALLLVIVGLRVLAESIL